MCVVWRVWCGACGVVRECVRVVPLLVRACGAACAACMRGVRVWRCEVRGVRVRCV